MKLLWVAFVSLSLVPPLTRAQSALKQDLGIVKTSASPAVIPESKSVNVTFKGKTLILTLDNLLNLPQVTVHVHNVYRNVDESYSGPLLADVLARVGLKPSQETEWDVLHSTLVATGNFNYFVNYSVAEVEPSFNSGKVIVAVRRSGFPNAEGGMIELVNTIDSNPIRWVHGLTDLDVVSLTPKK